MSGAGSRLGRYELLESLGAGGMGEVFRARDTRLGRDVALKVLLERFALDAQRRKRFEREAQLLASLSHPNIATLYGFEEAGGVQALALELVEGETLAERLSLLRRKRARLPLREALAIAEQIAAALEAAHETGVIHRDLKPSNIALKLDGTVKVLDFGLARALERDHENAGELAPTVVELEGPGALLGTPAYMSPEQARGLTVDKRTDIWAFGCTLYEMLAGERAFAGESQAEVFAHVLEHAPAFDALPPEVPPAVRRLLRRCLEKDPRHRLRDIGDARFELADSQALDASIAAATRTRTWRALAGRTLALLGLAAVASVAVVRLTPFGSHQTSSSSAAPPSARFYVETPGLASDGLAVHDLSPDGSTLVYVAEQAGTRGLYLRRMDELESRRIPGTDGAFGPFFSPDGQWVGFRADGQLKKVALAGGDPIVICECAGNTNAWGPDGTIIWGSGLGPLMRVSSDGGAPEPLTRLDDKRGETNQWAPQFLPNGDAVLFVSNRLAETDQRRRQVAVERLDTHERRVLFDGMVPRYLSTGHIAFLRQNSDALWVVPFDAERLEVTGDAIPVMTGVRVTANNQVHIAVSADGTLAYVPGTVNSRQGSLVWRDRTGHAEPPRLEPPAGFPRSPRLTSDGARFAASVAPPGETARNDVWIYDARGRQTPFRLTSWSGSSLFPVWTPDGTKIAFFYAPWGVAGTANLPNREVGLFLALADGSAQAPELLLADGVPQAWSPDGAELVVARDTAEADRDLWVVSVAGGGAARPLIATRFNEDEADVSPNGEWLAYVSDSSGRDEIYVQRYRGGAPIRVSRDGGHQPRWARDGRGLHYQSGRRMLFARVAATDVGLQVEPPEVLFEGGFVPYDPWQYVERTYDVAPDGRLIMVGLEDQAERIVIVQQWAQQAMRGLP